MESMFLPAASVMQLAPLRRNGMQSSKIGLDTCILLCLSSITGQSAPLGLINALVSIVPVPPTAVP